MNKNEMLQELWQLQTWFNVYYTQHEQKYNRLIALNKQDDDGIYGNTKLVNLYNEAEIKRARIQELERLLSDNSK